VQVGGLYEDRQGDANGASLGLFAILPKLDVVKASAYYLRKNMKSGFGDAFRLDERSLLAASLAYKMVAALLPGRFPARVGASARRDPDRSVDSFTAGFASFFEF